ncbi:MAG: DUF1080 domain-containing protein [Bacteroidetes bacterium]|nr:DUF1080 domain-containing protein [Bacteroidota bacterium]
MTQKFLGKNHTFLSLLIALTVLSFWSCNQQTASESNNEASLSWNKPIIADDWILLYDQDKNPTLDGWTGFNSVEISPKWEIIDNLLTVSIQGDDVDKNTGFGQSIVSKDRYKNFELEVHYRMSKGANSGIMYHVKQGTEYRDDYETGPEYQLLDNALARSESLPHRQVAALYDMFAPSSSPYHPAGEWNIAGIRLQDCFVEHYLNGVQVLSYDLNSEEFEQKRLESKWFDDADWAKTGEGHISIQDHGDKVEFRLIRIKPL